MTAKSIHPYCNICGWRKGGIDSWNGNACKCGHSEPPIPKETVDALDAEIRRMGLTKCD